MAENKEKINYKAMTASLKYFYSVIWNKFPSYIVYNFIAAILNAVMPIYSIFLPKILIDQFQQKAGFEKMAVTVLVFVVGIILTQAASSFCTQQYQKVVDAFNRYFEEQHKQKCAEMDFEKTEDPAVLNLSQKAQNGLNWYGGIDNFMRMTTVFISAIIQIIITGVILFTGSFWIVVLAVAAILIRLITTVIRSRVEFDMNNDFDILDRRLGYNFWQVYDFKYGKDIRLYGADEMLNKNCSEIADDYYHLELKTRKKFMVLSSVGDLATAGNRVGMYLILGIMVLKKKITLGNFSLYAGSATTICDALFSIMESSAMFMMVSNYLYNYVQFMNLDTDSVFGKDKVNLSDDHVIEFKDVWFKYPRSEAYILKGINIRINKGEKISIVGLNGAGKTTFIKLLCRLYKVDKGEILIDGKNINDYDFDEYSKLFSVVFQDYKLLAFSFKENIGVCENPDEERVTALSEKVGLGEKIKSMPNGIDNIMFRQFDEGGIEPSGGEQQKISIARALYQDSPIVILDEPTAALDPIAEYEIYKQFDEIVTGKTAIYISHRLSSCKFCDNIAVFKDGIIKEFGPHDRLIEIEDGNYRKMFDAQAKYYKDVI